MISFCTIGTLATSVSTPRSPRATITASAASTIDARLSMASRFSILATTRATEPRVRSSSFSSFTSTADRTNDRLTKSTPADAAHSACCQSAALIAATESFTPGRLTPWRLRIVPPWITRHRTQSALRSSTTRLIVPSASITESPTESSSTSGA